MTITLSDIKKLCKEKGISFRAASLFGVSKNDSGKFDCYIEGNDCVYAVKFITLFSGATHACFNNVGGGYISAKGASSAEDYMWVPLMAAKADGKTVVPVLLLDRDVIVTARAKNSATTVTAGATVFGCKVYTPSTFVKLF